MPEICNCLCILAPLEFPYSGVANELEQRAIRVAEVHAHSFTLSAAPSHRAQLDLHTTLPEMLNGLGYWRGPDETKIATTGWDGDTRHRLRDYARAMHIQSHVTELVDPASTLPQNFRAHDVKVESV